MRDLRGRLRAATGLSWLVMIEMKQAPADRDAMLLDLRTALRKIPPAMLRDLAKRRLPSDDLVERIVAEKLVKHLEVAGWEFGHQPPAALHRSL